MNSNEIKVTEIRITWSESRNFDQPIIIKRKTTENIWAEAEYHLRNLAYAEEDKPHQGYAKTDVYIIYADGYEYRARCDLKHPNQPDNDTNLRKHILYHMRFHAGALGPTEIPSHMTWELYQSILEDYGKETQQEAIVFLDNYEI